MLPKPLESARFFFIVKEVRAENSVGTIAVAGFLFMTADEAKLVFSELAASNTSAGVD
jgi:hypothetical protein